MEHAILAKRCDAAIRELNEHTRRFDAGQVVNRLNGGLNLLAQLLYVRFHEDVENMLGMDSMLAPISPLKTKQLSIAQIDLYNIAESAVFVREAGYIHDDGSWYVSWLCRLRLGETAPGGVELSQIAEYISQTEDQRRLAFTDVLAHVVPESNKAPLVLFQLAPLAAHISTALAFGDNARAANARARQIHHLPAINDCSQCKGRLLPFGEQCSKCGNPLWNIQWLTISD